MTTPQPSNQLPEEVNTGNTRTALWDHMHKEHRLSLLDSELSEIIRLSQAVPLAPRPPAPRGAECEGRYERGLLQQIEFVRDGKLPAVVLWRELCSDLRAIRHAPADSASAQLAAMREERDSESKWAKHYLAGLEQAEAQLAAARSEVGRLTKERDEALALFDKALRDGTPGLTFSMLNAYLVEQDAQLAALRRERDEAVAKFTDLNKSLMAELRDPSGTIWEHAEALQKERDELWADKERLDWLEGNMPEERNNILGCFAPTEKAPTIRAALDSARAKQGEGQG